MKRNFANIQRDSEIENRHFVNVAVFVPARVVMSLFKCLSLYKRIFA